MSPKTVRFFRQPAIVRFLEHSRRIRHTAGTTLVHRDTPSDRLYLLVEGSVSVIEDDEQGRELILAYLNPGDFIGEMGLFGDTPLRSAWIRTRTACELAAISYTRFERLQNDHPEMLRPVVAQITRRLRETNQRYRDLAFADVRARVCPMLRTLARQPEAMTHPDGMQLKVTRIELGRLVGCSREMVGRVLRDLEADQTISTRGHTIILHHPQPTGHPTQPKSSARRAPGSSARMKASPTKKAWIP